MKFKVGDKVIVNEKALKEANLGLLKIKKGIVTEIRDPILIRVRRGKENTL